MYTIFFKAQSSISWKEEKDKNKKAVTEEDKKKNRLSFQCN